MPFREIITVYRKHHTILTHLLRFSKLLNAKPDGKFSNKHAMKW